MSWFKGFQVEARNSHEQESQRNKTQGSIDSEETWQSFIPFDYLVCSLRFLAVKQYMVRGQNARVQRENSTYLLTLLHQSDFRSRVKREKGFDKCGTAFSSQMKRQISIAVSACMSSIYAPERKIISRLFLKFIIFLSVYQFL